MREEFEDVEITVDHSVTRLRVVSADPSVLHGVLDRIDAARASSCSTSTASTGTHREQRIRPARDADHPAGGEAAHPPCAYGSPCEEPATPGRHRHRTVEASRWRSVRSSTSSSGSPATSSTARSPPSSASSSRAARSGSSTSCSSPRTPTATSRAVEFEDHDDVALFNALEGEVGGLISEEDIEYAAAELEPNSSAALLIWEDVWATPFVEAMRNSGGVLIEGSRIPHDLIEAAEAELAAAG